MNARFMKAQRTGRVPIRLAESEKRNKKLNPPRKRLIAGGVLVPEFRLEKRYVQEQEICSFDRR